MSHEGVFHRGSKLAKSKKSVPHHLCGSATIPLKGGSYDFCSCQIRTPMKYWIVFMKKHFDRILKDMNPELKEVVKPIVETIKTVDYDPDSKQWVVIAVLSIIMSVFVLGIASRMIFNYMKVKKAILDTEDETRQENQPENA